MTDIASRTAVIAVEPTSHDSRLADDRPVEAAGAVARRRLGPVRELVAVARATTDFAIVLVAAALNFVVSSPAPFSPVRYLPAALLSAAIFVAITDRLGGYRPGRPQALARQLAQVATAWMAAVSVALVIAVAAGPTAALGSGRAAAWFLATLAALMSGRAIIHCATAGWSKSGALARRVVVVGAGAEGRKAVAKLSHDRDESVVLAVFDDRRGSLPALVERSPVLGTTDDLLQFARRQPIDQIVIALPLQADRELRAILDKLAVIPTDLRLSVDPLVEKFSVLGTDRVGGVSTIEIAARPLQRGAALCKWLQDKVLSALMLIFIAPLLAIIAALIKLDSRGPVFFVQDRFGFNNGVIRVLKFRTMYVDRADRSGAERTVPNDPRVTRMGRFLRQWSLDELPQLINVLRGEMSLVGPRPHPLWMRAGGRLYHEAVPRYPHRHRVKPGLTGWAQVNGFRGEVDTLEKASGRVEYDLYYIQNWSFWLDLKIILMTVGLLLSRANAY